MGVGHGHTGSGGPAGWAGARHRRRLWLAFGLLAGFMVVDAVAAWWTGSLALLSDAGHVATDVLGIGMALAAIHAAGRSAAGGPDPAAPPDGRPDGHPDGGPDGRPDTSAGATVRAKPHRTFGLYRLEVLAALANAVLLAGVAAFVLVEAVRRFGDPPEVRAGPMLVVAGVGLLVNLAGFGLLRAGARESLNVRGAYLEVLGDLLSSAGVIAAATVILLTGWWYADPILAVAVALFILPRTVTLARAALRVLVQAAPKHLAVTEVRATLAAVPGVRDVHDLHVWTLTSGMDVASAHLTIDRADHLGEVLAGARTALRDRYGIAHATLQVETGDCPPADW